MPSKRSVPVRVPVVRIIEAPELAPDVLPQVLREINDRQWGALIQVLIEAKYKAEAMLRNDSIYESAGKVAFYAGWAAYSDFILGNLEALRIQQIEPGAEPHPSPDDFDQL